MKGEILPDRPGKSWSRSPWNFLVLGARLLVLVRGSLVEEEAQDKAMGPLPRIKEMWGPLREEEWWLVPTLTELRQGQATDMV